MAKRNEERGVSLRPKDQTKGGGLWPSSPSPATLTDVHFEKTDFTRKDGSVAAKGVPCLFVTYETSVDGKAESFTETYSCGSNWKVVPERLIPQAGQTGLNDGCNAALFFNSLEDAGFDMESIDDDVTVLEGLAVVAHRRPQPKRDGGDASKSGGGDKTIVLIAELADEKPAKKGASKGKARDDDEDEEEAPAPKRGAGKSRREADDEEDEAPAKKPASAKSAGKSKAQEDELTVTAKEAVAEALEGGPLKLADLADAVADIVKGHPKRKAIVELCEDEDFLALEDGWVLKGTKISAA